MSITKLTGVLLTLVAVGGCSSMPSGPKFSGVEAANEGAAKVYIYRPERLFMRAAPFKVMLNERKVVELGNNGYLTLEVQPGKHTIVTDTTVIDEKTAFRVARGETRFLRLGLDRKPAICYCSRFQFELVKRDRAISELKNMRREEDVMNHDG